MRDGWAVVAPCPVLPLLFFKKKKETYRLLFFFLMNHEGWAGGGHPSPCQPPLFLFGKKKEQRPAYSPFCYEPWEMGGRWPSLTPCPLCPPFFVITTSCLLPFFMNHESWVGGGHPLPCLPPLFVKKENLPPTPPFPYEP